MNKAFMYGHRLMTQERSCLRGKLHNLHASSPDLIPRHVLLMVPRRFRRLTHDQRPPCDVTTTQRFLDSVLCERTQLVP
ncbi:hypothetical protein EVAR_57141_1 [Eumeta japonica]|uniref:Uncharacterized protein n=1 Tax=Eumeta variegata TaxID=151549 RepID=A0A4C1YVH5_EUMVA|nr:hypothetical protein EVAR_57141_1 [Eumeta japonica]